MCAISIKYLLSAHCWLTIMLITQIPEHVDSLYCYKCNGETDRTCDSAQENRGSAMQCDEGDRYCTILKNGSIIQRLCSNLIRCPKRKGWCCSCSDNYCNWKERCSDTEYENEAPCIGGSYPLVISSYVLFAYRGYL